MLVFLDQEPVFDAMNFGNNPDPDYTSSSAVVNRSAVVMALDALLCPSDGGPPLVQVDGGLYAGQNYFLNVGLGDSMVRSLPFADGTAQRHPFREFGGAAGGHHRWDLPDDGDK